MVGFKTYISNNIVNLKVFSLISPTDFVSINKRTLILIIISQHDIKRIIMLPIKNNNISFEGLDIHYHYSITGNHVRLAPILVIMFVSTFKLLLFYIYIVERHTIFFDNTCMLILFTFIINILIFKIYGKFAKISPYGQHNLLV